MHAAVDESRIPELEEIVRLALAEARRRGASECQVDASLNQGISASVRLGEIDTVEYQRDRGLGITVYFGKKKGSASTADLAAGAVSDMVEKACSIARYTAADECAGLPDPENLARDIPNLDLEHPWALGPDEAIELAPIETEPWARAASLLCKAYMLGQSDLTAQAACARMAVAVAREADIRELEAEALSVVCYNAYFRDALEEGLALGAEAVAIARELGNLVVLGQALLAYAAVVYVDDTEGAEAIFREALSVVEQSGDLFTTSFLRNNYACLLLLEDRVAEARHQFEAALTITRTLVPRRTPGTLNNLGLVLLKEGDNAGAAALFTDGLRTSRLAGDVSAPAYSTLGLACLATLAGDLETAAILHGGANALLEAHGGAWESPEKEYRDDDIRILRARLGAAFEILYETGGSKHRDEIVELALGRRAGATG